MPKGLPQSVKINIEKCRAAATAAVEVYNRPGTHFRTAHFLILIVIAWTACFHAYFYRKRVNPWYKKKGKSSKGDRYLRIDGDPKHWDLAKCAEEYFGGNNPPERKNLEFLIGLRNKIEHRHLPDLDAGLYGECQAALLNLEEFITKEFGARFALAEQLLVALQFSQLIPAEKKKAAKAIAASSVKSVRDYVEKFRGNLPSSTLNSMKYSFNVFLVPRVVNRPDIADTAVEFIRIDESNTGELERLEKLNILIKEKHIPIANLGFYKPSQVVAVVAAKIPYRFSTQSHAGAWSHFKVRPKAGAPKPEITDGKYCIYDKAHADYLYTEAWIDKLVLALRDTESFKAITGYSAVAKNASA